MTSVSLLVLCWLLLLELLLDLFLLRLFGCGLIEVLFGSTSA